MSFGVAARRIVGACDPPAGQAQPQFHPGLAGSKAVPTAISVGHDRANPGGVSAPSGPLRLSGADGCSHRRLEGSGPLGGLVISKSSLVGVRWKVAILPRLIVGGDHNDRVDHCGTTPVAQ
jgi:hypothetical protein